MDLGVVLLVVMTLVIINVYNLCLNNLFLFVLDSVIVSEYLQFAEKANFLWQRGHVNCHAWWCSHDFADDSKTPSVVLLLEGRAEGVSAP